MEVIKLYFDEKEMFEICERYGIEIIDKNDSDYYTDEDFSMLDIMKEPYIHTVVEKNIFSKTMEIAVTFQDDLGFCGHDDISYTCSVSRDLDYNNVSSVIDKNTVMNKAA